MELIEIYIKQISKYSMLCHEETLEQFKKFHEGDKNAKERIYTSNLGLVIDIAKSYLYNSEEDLIDIIQDGNLGLEYAIKRFNPSRNCRFSTYATYCINGYIKVALHKKKIPHNSISSEIKDEKSPSPEEEAINSQRKEFIAKALANLPLEDRLLLQSRYGLFEYNKPGDNYPLTLKECGSIFKITNQAVNARENSLLKKLRYYLTASLL